MKNSAVSCLFPIVLVLSALPQIAEAQNSQRKSEKQSSTVSTPSTVLGEERVDLSFSDVPMSEVVNLLRNKFPGWNFVMTQQTGTVKIGDLTLHSADLNEVLHAIEIASDRKVAANATERTVTFISHFAQVPINVEALN